ncbi:hypothetical protein P256_01896 [Acinetobacter nectaris CIP 110549]|uniref:Uncharacterized protein n=1 Tax=Acinetobacter nectaris CIP 110549 TaxID=1392540 RepID=V2TLY5_9GAMM|nr:hypothetical protein [Acinetobacter nectaris]ESK38362.1 hypothetical protein P256_01896 [Acinetobacter nectaris CIP 110549]MCF9000108.1 hypothetical protein [Acinetobacter nectaris]MCF9027140.1 hypothetical protein [Acinetobacter nectaris]MCF9047154.1 hypothetical protein [Acinetobacter nectaris]
MQQVNAFLQGKISISELDIDQLIKLIRQHPNPESVEYKLLELTLNQVLAEYLKKAESYISGQIS